MVLLTRKASDTGDECNSFHAYFRAPSLRVQPPVLTLPKGSGPRHIAFSPTVPAIAYASLELSVQVTVLHFDIATATLSAGPTYPLLPPTFSPNPQQSAAEVAVTPDGRCELAPTVGSRMSCVHSC
jgi:6-phosphogluconolactonase (cycloisomerase 2 family)